MSTTAKDLRAICEQFDEHVNACPECDLVIQIERTGEIFLVEIGFTKPQPKLCPIGRGILLDIFGP